LSVQEQKQQTTKTQKLRDCQAQFYCKCVQYTSVNLDLRQIQIKFYLFVWLRHIVHITRVIQGYKSNFFHHDFVQFGETRDCQLKLNCQMLLKSPPLNLRAGSTPDLDTTHRKVRFK